MFIVASLLNTYAFMSKKVSRGFVLKTAACSRRWQFLLSCFSGLLYYAGHGYENFGEQLYVVYGYLRNPYRSEKLCLCVWILLAWCERRDSTCSCWTCAGKGGSVMGDLLVAGFVSLVLQIYWWQTQEAFEHLELLNFRLWVGLIKKTREKRFSLCFQLPCSKWRAKGHGY